MQEPVSIFEVVGSDWVGITRGTEVRGMQGTKVLDRDLVIRDFGLMVGEIDCRPGG
jgi:hypothetical protein